MAKAVNTINKRFICESWNCELGGLTAIAAPLAARA
jgi:hypothetical protein